MLNLRKTPLGFHFFDRSSGLNILIDEKIPPEGEWSEAPRTLSIALTDECNSYCTFCYVQKKGSALPYEAVLRWATEFDKNGGQSIGFGGGEPTLYPELPRLCRTISETTSLAVTVTTNGQSFSASLADRLTGSVNFIRLSIGGLNAGYEKMHGRPFSALLSNLQNIKRVSPIGFNILVSPGSLSHLTELVDFASSNGAQEILMLPLVSSSGVVFLSKDQRSRFSRWIDQNYDRYHLSVSAIAQEFISGPRLPIEDPRGPTYDFLHINSSRCISCSAFTDASAKIDEYSGLLAAVSTLRSLMTSEGRTK